MAFNIISGARLAAGILFYHEHAKHALWHTESRAIKNLRETLHVQPSQDKAELARQIQDALNSDPGLCQKLEMDFPNLTFAPLLERLGEQLANRLASGNSPVPEEVVKELNGLLGLEEKTGAQPKELAPLLSVALFFRPRIAARVALALEEGLPYPWTRFQEIEAITASRQLRGLDTSSTSAANMQPIGLALSGGGIRSATLNLGLLQALADLKLTPYIDYLSTVSGGGYIGGWFHAWLCREKSAKATTRDGDHPKPIEKLQAALSPEDSPDPESVATHPIKWLRQYSNYLAPRLGLLSPDTWDIFTVWVRNWILNLIIISLALAAVLLIPRGASAVFDTVHYGGSWWLGSLSLGSLAAAVITIQLNLLWFKTAAASGNPAGQTSARGPRIQSGWVHHLIAAPVLLSAMVLAAWLGKPKLTNATTVEVIIAASFFVLLCYVSFGGGYRNRPEPGTDPGKWDTLRYYACAVIYNAISAAAGFVLLLLARKLFAWMSGPTLVWRELIWHQLVWGTAIMATVYSLVVILHLGLFGRSLGDDRREWWSRLGAVQSIWLLGWVSVAATAIYGPWLTVRMITGSNVAKAISALLGSGWFATTIAGVLKGSGDKTGPISSEPRSDLIARIAPPVFAAGFLLLISVLLHISLFWMMRLSLPDLVTMADRHFVYLSWWSARDAWLFAAVLLALAYGLASRVDVNEFSMHNFYQNRLVRCYLGASHENRQPNRFTGFDAHDDIQLSRLNPLSHPAYAGPYAIVNATLNLSSGEELAWQERKAQAFVFTPLYSGFASTPTEERSGPPKLPPAISYYAYRPTVQYAFSGGGIWMGNAMAISGAALSPNWGYHTSTATAFLLTVFNVRLGWWIGNPRHSRCWRRPGPRAGLGYLLLELAGATDSKRGYVYLSDGGHFENLGIYELVRRRCPYIIVCDGGEDASYSYDDLGNAIRKCRADFGVEIKIDLSSIRPAADDSGGRPFSKVHCAVGRIDYPPAPNYEKYKPRAGNEPQRDTGTLIYLKATLTGDEPADILEYAARNPEFPHQSTADQFFDESQFESYRRLGYHIGKQVFGDAVDRRSEVDKQTPLDSGFFADLRRQWRASSPRTAASFTRLAEELVKLMRRLREDSDLGFFERQINPEWQRLMKGAEPALSPDNFGLPPTVDERRAGFHFCNSILQLMEDVYLDLNLEEEYDHPDNAGWMNLFDHWSWSAMFRVTWMISASCYGARFRTFCEYRLHLDTNQVGCIKIQPEDQQWSYLNYREKDLLRKAAFQWDGFDLYALNVIVKRPDDQSDLTVLTVGFAVVRKQDRRLAYLRIQQHLRSMGLARRMVVAMVEQINLGREPDWADVGHIPEPVTLANQERIERMIEAAHLRRAATNHKEHKP